MRPAVQRAVGEALGSNLRTTQSVGGGSINESFAATLEDGREVFIKTHTSAHPDMYPCEARGLDWMRQARALRIPEVLAVSDPTGKGPHFIAMEMLHAAKRQADFDEQLGRGLAQMHSQGPSQLGLEYTNFIATLSQDNRAPQDGKWSTFYGEQRLLPLARKAEKQRHFRSETMGQFARLLKKLDNIAGPEEPPARLHGDLWGGNLHCDENGAPCLIDPAVYGGHREIDLAMMRMFGGFSERCFDAYNEAYPLAPGYRERIPLYQLYPLLVHVVLFGGSYVSSAQSALGRYL
jgi:fructosamine-3-kinase